MHAAYAPTHDQTRPELDSGRVMFSLPLSRARSVLTVDTYAAGMFKRPPRDRVLTVAMVLFAIGLVAVAATFVLFAIGHRDLPAWLSVTSMLLPLGFAIGAVRTVRQWRRSDRNHPADH
jgi:fatty acid desaturase